MNAFHVRVHPRTLFAQPKPLFAHPKTLATLELYFPPPPPSSKAHVFPLKSIFFILEFYSPFNPLSLNFFNTFDFNTYLDLIATFFRSIISIKYRIRKKENPDEDDPVLALTKSGSNQIRMRVESPESGFDPASKLDFDQT